LRWLSAQGCTLGQGHYFSEPLSESQVRLLLANDARTGSDVPRMRRQST
jgi:EAL domain-containing protein (putative c-di-GMP-specific phosphodiesterase class I)